MMKAVGAIFGRIFTGMSRFWWVWLILAMLSTYALVMVLSVGQSVWFDESYSITLAHMPVGELIAQTGVDAHPPFYYLLLKGWAEIFGWSEFALRSLSAVAASLAVGGLFFAIRKLFTVRVAMVVLPFLVLAPFSLRYGYEIRMYAVTLLIAVLATLVLVYASSRKQSKLWILYAVLVALGMFTLYMSIVVWLAHAVWLLVVTKKKGLEFFKQPWVLAFIGAVVLFAIYIPTFVYQMTHSALPGIGHELTLTQMGGLLSLLFVFMHDSAVGGIASLAILAIVALTVYLLMTVYRKLPKSSKPALLLVVALVVVPILFYGIISALSPIFITRYAAHIALFVYALVGVAVALGWRFGKRIPALSLAGISLVVLVVGVFQLQTTGNFVFERWQHPETKQLRTDITCDQNTIIVADDPYTYIDSSYYFEDCQQYFFSETNIEKQGGYASLRDSTVRISAPVEVTQRTLVHLRWVGNEPSFVPDSRYKLVETKQYDKQQVDTYELQS